MQTKVKFFVYTVAACLTLSSLTGCLESGDAEEDQPSQEEPAPSDGSQTKAQLAGSYRTCDVLSGGSATNGKAFVRYVTLNADGTYSYLGALTGGTSCSYGGASGGSYNTVYAQYNLSGTWATNGIAGTSTTGTKVDFTPTTSTWTVYKPQDEAVALALANWATSDCGITYSTTGTDSDTFQPSSCGVSTSVSSLGTPPTLNVQQHNVIYKDGSTKKMGTNVNVWGPSAGMYPTSFSSNTWY